MEGDASGSQARGFPPSGGVSPILGYCVFLVIERSWTDETQGSRRGAQDSSRESVRRSAGPWRSSDGDGREHGQGS